MLSDRVTKTEVILDMQNIILHQEELLRNDLRKEY